ncbi:MAG: 3-isopropylmalate dehydrogenase [Peptostreptococcaceae bacterium]
MEYNIVTLPGDGIGPEIVEQAILVLDRIGELYGHKFNYKEKLIGGVAIDKIGCSLPKDTIDECKKSDAILLGAVGGPKWDTLAITDRPEKGLLGIRKSLGLFSNLRPAILYKQLSHTCPLKESIVGDELNIIIVRELTSGIYFGKQERVENKEYSKTYATDTEYYSVEEIEKIVRVGFNVAMKRQKRITVVDKANVLESSKLWREVVKKVVSEYPGIECSYMYVDNAAMQLVVNPRQFDVIITSNMFGDILSDEASVITGSIGMLPSASIGNDKLGLYEPIHGSAPEIAGQNKANPIGTILSVVMMLRYSLGLEDEAISIENSINKVLDSGYRTIDIMSKDNKCVGTREMGRLIIQNLV